MGTLQTSHRVLIITGGLLSLSDRSVLAVMKRQLAVLRRSSAAWLDIYLKVRAIERVLRMRRFSTSRQFRKRPEAQTVQRLLAVDDLEGIPELTEVVLATALEAEGIPFEVTTLAAIYSDAALRSRLLASCSCVFLSTTLLRDVSELRPTVELIAAAGVRVVVGGALTGILARSWPACPGIDLVAVGYGEWLVPVLARWIRSGFAILEPPPRGRITEQSGTTILHSGVPDTLDLDFLPRPDWSVAERTHGRAFPIVSYESVRGCPYRCAFCNYPFLFDDRRFRVRSAACIARDWEHYAAQGAHTVICLDSLFTMPRRRIDELCSRLIALGTPLRWSCYARADDLTDASLCARMVEAGCVQVQIGIESGSQEQLDRMDKRCTVAHNAAALRNCRDVGLPTLVTLLIGFPGETARTIDETLEFMRGTAPDFFFVSPFSVKYEALPVLSPESRQANELVTVQDGYSSFPYWRHRTMSCIDAVESATALADTIAQEGLALDGAMFYPAALAYKTTDRPDLLAFQTRALQQRGVFDPVVGMTQRWVRKKMLREAQRVLPPPAQGGA